MSRLSSLKSLLSGNKGINYINGSRVIGSGTPEKLYNPACGQVKHKYCLFLSEILEYLIL
jgi:hypothetical protein